MSELDDLKKQLEELTAIVEEAKETLAPIQKEKAALSDEEKAAYEAYQATAAKCRARKQALDEKAYDAQVRLNQNQAQLNAAQRLIEEAERKTKIEEERKAREEELLTLNAKWDRLTAGAPWREWAKDHQIEAGHKITQDRYVILADPMGLGKTLSAIITCDMAEAATRLATPGFPFLGEMQDVYVDRKIKRLSDGAMLDYYSNLENLNLYPNDYEVIDAHYEKRIVGGIERPVGKRVLYLCPSSLIRNVEKEFRMWAKHRSVTFVGGMPKGSRQFAMSIIKQSPEFVVICNYEAWRKDRSLIEDFISLDLDTIIIDEAHNLKDMKTSAYRGAKEIIDATKPEYVIPMTGTPLLNRPQELFSLLTFVNPKRFYREKDFLYDYCEQDDNGYWRFKPGGLERIARQISKNFMRRTRDQAGIELPEKTIIYHDIKVDTETYKAQGKAREQMAKYATLIVDEAKGQAVTATVAIAMFTRLRQIETWPAGIVIKDEKTGNIKFQVDVKESQKIDYFISNDPDETGNFQGIIPEVIEDERIVLFSQFKPPLHEIKRRIERAGWRAVVLDGDTPVAMREQIAMDFDRRHTPKREDARWDIVLCNYKVGGVGLNLTAATQMMILDEEWNPGKRDQAFDRIHRIGQEEAVTIHVARNEGTIDDWLASIMERKEGLVEGFQNAMIDMDEFRKFLDDGGLK